MQQRWSTSLTKFETNSSNSKKWHPFYYYCINLFEEFLCGFWKISLYFMGLVAVTISEPQTDLNKVRYWGSLWENELAISNGHESISFFVCKNEVILFCLNLNSRVSTNAEKGMRCVTEQPFESLGNFSYLFLGEVGTKVSANRSFF
jgi:hypothetical protein